LLKKRFDEVDVGAYSTDTKKLTFEKVAASFLESKVNIRNTKTMGRPQPAEHVEKLKQPVSSEADLIDANVLTAAEINQLLEAAHLLRGLQDLVGETETIPPESRSR
jgi:hypothetical protein